MKYFRWILTCLTVLASAVVLYAQNPISILRVGPSTDVTTTLPVSGSVTVTQGTGTNLHTVIDSGTTTVTQGTGTNLHTVIDSGSTTAVTGNVTVVQPTGTNLHAVLDTTSTTAVTQATAANLNATVVGTGTFATQSAITAASASIASGAIASGAIASGAVASGAIASGAIASGAIASGAVASGAYASDSGSFGVGSTGSAPPAKGAFATGIVSGATGGFLGGFAACDTYKTVSITSGTTTLIITGVSGRQVHICSLHFVTAIANNVALIEGTGATCGTNTTGMSGGSTAANGWNFAANGGLTLGSGLGTVIQTVTTGESVCLITSAAGPLAGGISYAIY